MGTGMKRIVLPPSRVGVPFLKLLPSRSVTRPPLKLQRPVGFAYTHLTTGLLFSRRFLEMRSTSSID